jgi:hypothetical protein
MAKITSQRLLDKVVKYGDRLTGHSKRRYDSISHALKDAPNVGIRNIPSTAVRKADRLSKDESKRVVRTRVGTGLSIAGVAGGGFLGLHKYHQHKDNKILERIDNMGKKK